MLAIHNEFDELKRVAICSPPANLPKTKREAEFVHFYATVQANKFHSQHKNLAQILVSLGVEVIDLSAFLAPNSLVNRIFVRDLGVVVNKKVLLSVTKIRRAEFYFLQQTLEKLISKKHLEFLDVGIHESFEGGDFFLLNKDVALCNFGKRSFLKNPKQLLRLGLEEVGIISIPDSTIHLDLSLNLSKGTIIAERAMRFCYVQVIKPEKTYFMPFADFASRHGYKVVFINTSFGMHFNFININEEQILTSAANQHFIKSVFPSHDIIAVEAGELEKGGGSIRCLTLPMLRE